MGENERIVNFGVVGCGRMGRHHAQRLQLDGRGKIVACYDEHPETADSLRRDFCPEAACCADLPDLLNVTDVDAVIIATPTTSHFDQVRLCRARGKHVLCEKPLAESRRRIVQLIEESQATEPLLSIAYQCRYWSTYRLLQEELQSGRWGKVLSISSTVAERWQQTIHQTWRDDPSINGGGFVGDAGSHKLDIIFHLTGLVPAQVYATSEKLGSRVEIVTHVTATLVDPRADRRPVPLSMSFTGNAETFLWDLHLNCERGTLLARDNRVYACRDNERTELPVNVEETGMDATTNPVTGFLDQLLAGAAPVAPPACALPVFDMTAGILRSSETGLPVVVD